MIKFMTNSIMGLTTKFSFFSKSKSKKSSKKSSIRSSNASRISAISKASVTIRRQHFDISLILLFQDLSQGQTNEIRDLFGLFDIDGNGNITKEELHVVMTSMGYNITKGRD